MKRSRSRRLAVVVEVLKPSSSPPPSPSPAIQMAGHCIICLRKTTREPKKKMKLEKLGNFETEADEESKSTRELLEQVPSAVIPDSVNVSGLVNTLNRVWGWIQNNKKECVKAEEKRFEDYFCSKESGVSGTFRDLPELCQFCCENLASVDKLMRELVEMLDKLGSIARESKCGGTHGWRGETFVKALTSSNLEAGSIRHTLELLGLNGSLEDTDSVEASSSSSLHLDSDPLASCNSDSPEFVDSIDECPLSMADLREPVFTDEDDSMDIKSEVEEGQEEEGNDSDSHYPMLTGEVDSDPDYIKSEVEEDTVSSADSEVADSTNADSDDDEFYTNVVISNPSKSLSNPGPCSSSSSTAATTILITPQGKIINFPQQKCDLCNAMVPISSILEHVRAHVGDAYLNKCPNKTCPFVFSYPRAVSDHLNNSPCGSTVTVATKKIFTSVYSTCQTCGFLCWRPPLFKMHLLKKHQDPVKSFPCPINGCTESFCLKQSVILHITNDHTSNPDAIPQLCPLCKNKEKIPVKVMKTHLKDKHQITTELIKCTYCPFLFPNRELLLDHLYSHRHEGLSCDICNDDVKFNYHANLRKHYFEAHQIGQSYPCDQCTNVYWTLDILKSHVYERHSDNKYRRKRGTFRCEDCDKEWKSPASFQDHNISFHGGEPWKCRFCAETFTKRLLLDKHTLEKHKGGSSVPVKKFLCEVPGCGKEFLAERSVRKHVSAVHLNVRPFVCDVCGKGFPLPGQLEKHKNGIHLGIRPHVCEFCGEGFMEALTLKNHRLIHTGELPYSCEICGQGFRQAVVLKRHLEGHQKKGASFKPNGPMKGIRKRVERKNP